jgi:translation initiation factor IF-3
MQERGHEDYGMIRIIPDKLQLGVDYTKTMSFDDAQRLADRLGLDLVCVNEAALIYTITNEEKFLYAEKKRKKNKPKEQKTIKIKAGISSADLARKLENILEFKKEGHPVKIEWFIPQRMKNDVNITAFKSFLTVLSSHFLVKIPETIEIKTILYI